MQILVLGVFDSNSVQNWICNNVFSEIFKKQNITFINSDTLYDEKINPNLIILAGGEISEKSLDSLDKYNTLFKLDVPKIALSIGISNLESYNYLENFNHIYHRNKVIINTLLSNQYYLPDLAFGLSKNLIFSNLINSKNNINPKIAVFLNFLNDDEMLKITHILNLLSIDNEINLYNCNIKNLEYFEKNLNNSINYKLNIDNNKLLNEIGLNDYAICMRYYSFILCTIMRVPFIGICKNSKTNLYMKEQNLDNYNITNLDDSTAQGNLLDKFKELTVDANIKDKLEEIYIKNNEMFNSLSSSNWISEYILDIYYLFSLSDRMGYTYNLIKYLGFRINKEKNGYKLRIDENNTVTTTLQNCTKMVLNNCQKENSDHLRKLSLQFDNCFEGPSCDLKLLDSSNGINTYMLGPVNEVDPNVDEWIGIILNSCYLKNIFDMDIEILKKCTGIYIFNQEIYNLCHNYLYMKELEIEIELIKDLNILSILNSKIYKLI
jgi:hypothetical protein